MPGSILKMQWELNSEGWYNSFLDGVIDVAGFGSLEWGWDGS
jgi:hypothetical protein